jgi:kynureninase
MLSLAEADRRDREDPLAARRQQFLLPADKVYLDGNSLGALPAAVPAALARTVEAEWGTDLIESWNSHGWFDLARRVGERIAPLVGAAPGQVICADSISVNLFKLLATALALRPGRRTILVEAGDFPTDRYLAQGLAELLGHDRCRVRAVEAEGLVEAIDEDVAVLMLTEVNFRSGRRHDMRALSAAAQARGALALWDLAHSAGAMPVALDASGADLAVGCGYKFLNGGPGAPAYVYVAERHQGRVAQPLAGWFGHRAPFAFTDEYTPAPGVLCYQAGTPSVLALRALDAALDVFEGVEPAQLREKSLGLSSFFLDGLAASPAFPGVGVLTPADPERRGSQLSLTHRDGYALARALIEAGVIVDFREPDVVRFGFAPLYTSYRDVAIAVQTLAAILGECRQRARRFRERAPVT